MFSHCPSFQRGQATAFSLLNTSCDGLAVLAGIHAPASDTRPFTSLIPGIKLSNFSQDDAAESGSSSENESSKCPAGPPRWGKGVSIFSVKRPGRSSAESRRSILLKFHDNLGSQAQSHQPMKATSIVRTSLSQSPPAARSRWIDSSMMIDGACSRSR